jgi:hypothetical protein
LVVLLNTVMNILVLQNAGKLSNGYTTGDLSNSAQFYRVYLMTSYKLSVNPIIK